MPSAARTTTAPPAPRAALLTGAYRRLGALSRVLRLSAGAPPHPAGTLVRGTALAADPAVLNRMVAHEESRIRTVYGVRPRRDVAATWALHRYAFTACLAVSGPWYLERRVPRLPLDQVAWDWHDSALTCDPEELLCLPGDPAEGLPGVRTVPGEEELRAELRQAVADHLAPVLAAFRPLIRRGPHALWAMAADELAEGIRYLGELLGDPHSAARAANALLPGGTAPYVGSAGFSIGPGSDGAVTRTRSGCCLYYTIRPAEACRGCPRVR